MAPGGVEPPHADSKPESRNTDLQGKTARCEGRAPLRAPFPRRELNDAFSAARRPRDCLRARGPARVGLFTALVDLSGSRPFDRGAGIAAVFETNTNWLICSAFSRRAPVGAPVARRSSAAQSTPSLPSRVQRQRIATYAGGCTTKPAVRRVRPDSQAAGTRPLDLGPSRRERLLSRSPPTYADERWRVGASAVG
jgi:hypothetical protein